MDLGRGDDHDAITGSVNSDADIGSIPPALLQMFGEELCFGGIAGIHAEDGASGIRASDFAGLVDRLEELSRDLVGFCGAFDENLVPFRVRNDLDFIGVVTEELREEAFDIGGGFVAKFVGFETYGC